MAAYEENRRFVHARRPEIAVLASGDEHLLTSYLIGTEGSQVSLAAVVPELVVGLFSGASGSDWAAARAAREDLSAGCCHGGNTTVLPFCLQEKGMRLRGTLAAYHELAEGNCYTDVSFQSIVSDPTSSVLGQELPALVDMQHGELTASRRVVDAAGRAALMDPVEAVVRTEGRADVLLLAARDLRDDVRVAMWALHADHVERA